MTEETTLFIRKLKELEALWVELKLNVNTTQLERLSNLEARASTLLANIKSEKSLNVGGKFEWVNSILVKCMQEGSWLLIDNVNLCSPAVLDRLNALLEPNGVLTIGERGMNENGEMYEIKPHKDFRLFLTMDPKNGEISRAMRNRGIEICLLNENEDPSIVDELDLKALINHCGVINTGHIGALLKIHQFVGELTLGEKPNINHLLQAAFLMAEQLQRGVDLLTAITCSVTDVYYKSRRNSEFTVNDACELINEKIHSVIYDKSDFYNPSMSLQTRNLTLNSHLENIRQQTVFLNDDGRCLEDVLISAFTIANSLDLKLRYTYIKSILSQFKDDGLQGLCDKFFRIASRWGKNRHELPFDYRWLPNTKQLASPNNLYMSLYFESRTYVRKAAYKQKRKLTLLDFLNGVRCKRTEPKMDHILEKELLNLLDAFDKFFVKSLYSTNVKIDDTILCDLLSLLQWRFILYHKLNCDIWNITISDYQKLMETVHIHYKWFTKSFEKLVKLIKMGRNNTVAKIITDINSKSSYDFSTLHKLSKLYQKAICRPPPPISQEQIVTYEEFRLISDGFDMYNHQNDFWRLLRFLIKNPELRPLLISARQRVQVDNELKSLHNRFIKNDEDVECIRDRAEILPIIDHFARLTVIGTKRDFNLDKEICTKAHTVPPELLAVWETFTNTTDECVKHELNTNTFLYLQNAASVTPFKFKLQESDECSNPKTFPQFAPALSFSVVNLLVPDVNHKATIRATTYGNYKEITEQHKLLNLALWRNMAQLSYPNYDFIKCESRYIQKSFLEFQKDFANCLNVENNEGACLKGIRKLYGKSSSLQNEKGERDLLLVLFKQCTEEFVCLRKNENLDTIANLYFLLGYLRTLLNSKLPLIDPLAKKQLKKQYCIEEINDYLRIVRCYELQNSLYSGKMETLHTHSLLLQDRIKALEIKCKELSKYTSVRSQDPSYSTVSKEILHYFDMVVSPLQIVNLFYSLNTNSANIQEAIDKKCLTNTNEIEKRLKETKQLCTTFSSLVAVLKKYRYNFPDVVMPLLSSVTEFLYALTLKFNISYALLTKYKNIRYKIDVSRDLINVTRFPAITKDQTDYIDAIQLYTRSHIREFIKVTLENETISKRENFRLLKCGMQELHNMSLLDAQNYKTLDSRLFDVLEDLIKVFVKSWKQQQEELEQKHREEKSLYKITSKTEEDEIAEEFQKLFPSFHDQDFSDLEPKMLDDDEPEMETNTANDYVGIISLEDVKFASKIHSTFLYSHTRTEWLAPQITNTKPDFITPLLAKCKFFQMISMKYTECLNYTVDAEFIGTLNVLVTVAQNFGNMETAEDCHYDFYKDPNVTEVKISYHDLKELHQYITQLLDKWPDHPTLKMIHLVIERIYNFDIASPLSRFLTGFEILLSKCHEWEENAHYGVSIQEYIQNLVRHIIRWRKIEMNVWKESLNIAFERLNEPIAKWWFYIYELVIQFIDDEGIRVDEVLATLKKFITQSNLAEFSNRLQLLLSFHYYITHMKRTTRSDALLNILWNLYQYFKQFEANVTTKIKELRLPIEKKLKEYIKIVKWKDISYWAIKQTVERTHKTLHKHIREFENVVKQPVADCLVSIANEIKATPDGIWEQKEITRHNTNSYLSKFAVVKVQQALEQDDIFVKAEVYFKRSRALCKKTILRAEYQQLIQTLDDFVKDVITSSAHLQGLEVDTTLPKEKQKSQAKGILLQKRKGLADLFKALTEIGLSYRTGIVYSKSREETNQFLIKPINLQANLSHLRDLHENDEKVLQIWSGCELYYYKSFSKLESLRIYRTNPAKDLGFQNLERCTGFAEVLMQIVQELKTSLVKTSRTFYHLRHYYSCLDRCTKSSSLTYLPISKYETMLKLIKNVIIVLEQFKLILNTCPNYGDESMELPILKPVPMDFIWHKNDETWLKCMEKITSSLTVSQKILHNLSNALHSIPSTEFKCAKKMYIEISLDEVLTSFDTISENLEEIGSIFKEIPLTNNMQWLQSEIESMKLSLLQIPKPVELADLTKFKRFSRLLIRKLLLTVQVIYKKSQEKDLQKEEPQLKRDHLKTLILENLSKDLTLLDMPTVLKQVHRLVAELYKISSCVIPECNLIVSQIMPIFEQVLLLYQYYFTQQVSVYRTACKMNSILCNIFTDLTTKGFCVPPEFSEELNSEDGTQQMGGGLGLGEGEGERDVSDRIESEDQLEDAEPAGKEKDEKDDKDCKEEEKGIEMSEDFDAKMQDVGKGDDKEDGQSDSDDDEAEEQMGETEKEAEQLDQEIWGSDNEEDENDDGEEDGSGGEKQGEDQLGAKEHDSPEANEQGNSKEEKKEEINEMKEPEIDDDQIDPYHGNPPKYPEPEAMDLPDDLQVDDDMQENNENPNEENPFDIDTMKEQAPPPEPEPEETSETLPDENTPDADGSNNASGDEEGNEKDEKKDAPDDTKDERIKESEEANEKNEDREKPQSMLDETQSKDAESQAMDVDDIAASDNVKTNPSENQENAAPTDEINQEDNPDKEGVGQSRMEQSMTGHKGQAVAQDNISSNRQEKEDVDMKRKPGESDSKRSLGDVNEPVKKKLKTIDLQEKDENVDDYEDEQEQSAEMYKHIQNAAKSDDQVLDTATKEQADEQKDVSDLNKKEETTESKLLEEEEEEEVDIKDGKKQNPEKIESDQKRNKLKQHPEGELLDEVNDVEIEGEYIPTVTVPRGDATTHHTRYTSDTSENISLSISEMNRIRTEVEQQLSEWVEAPSNLQAEQAWKKISSVTSSLAQNLSEQLRLVLEPTQTSHLKGDYRTGRRINMRKVIPYIASQFRKDKIWLRRTKPSKRDYKIVLAIDDSSSMSDNHSKELAFESVALISKALTLLESGQLSVLSFGETTQVLHKLVDTFSEKSGANILQKFQFLQQKTCIGKLVDFATEMLNSAQISSSASIAKLLIIVSDGRGIFSEGEIYVKQAVRRAKLSNVFMVFVIVDNPDSKSSILDIRMPIFKDGKLLRIESYMDSFPFPFYIILRNINSLPNVLSDALRQWFEIVSNVDKQ